DRLRGGADAAAVSRAEGAHRHRHGGGRGEGLKEPHMLTSRFPRTGAEVSRLGYGGAAIGLTNYLGHYDAHAERPASVAAVRKAAEDGLTYFDTAPGYGAGLSEEIFGEALEGRTGIAIATKVKAEKHSDVRASLEASLRRLRRDRIDLLQIH